MEEQIKKTAARVRTTFAYFWMLPILLVLLGETGGGWVGMYAGDVRATFMAETVTILLAASCVPIALKLFSWVLIRKIDVVTLPEALRLYALWSGVRLALLAIPVLAGIFTYYIFYQGLKTAIISRYANGTDNSNIFHFIYNKDETLSIILL